MKRNLVMSLLVLALTLASVQPAFAATVDLNIHNNTDGTVKITLTGPKNYSFDAPEGKMAKTVEEGTYKYSYTACGVKQSGEIKVEDDLQWLIIEQCGAAPEYAKFTVDVHIDAATLKLVGPQSYDLAVELGTNKFLSLQTGFYAYSYDACGTTYTGEIRITKNGTARLTLYSCEVAALHQTTVDSSISSPSNLRIGSHYAFPVRMTILGLVNYSFEIGPGLNRLNVAKGEYSFFYVAYGVTRSGTFTVDEAGTSFIISPVR